MIAFMQEHSLPVDSKWLQIGEQVLDTVIDLQREDSLWIYL